MPSRISDSNVAQAARGLYLLRGARGALDMLAVADDLNASGKVSMARLSLEIAEQIRLLDEDSRNDGLH